MISDRAFFQSIVRSDVDIFGSDTSIAMIKNLSDGSGLNSKERKFNFIKVNNTEDKFKENIQIVEVHKIIFVAHDLE